MRPIIEFLLKENALIIFLAILVLTGIVGFVVYVSSHAYLRLISKINRFKIKSTNYGFSVEHLTTIVSLSIFLILTLILIVSRASMSSNEKLVRDESFMVGFNNGDTFASRYVHFYTTSSSFIIGKVKDEEKLKKLIKKDAYNAIADHELMSDLEERRLNSTLSDVEVIARRRFPRDISDRVLLEAEISDDLLEFLINDDNRENSSEVYDLLKDSNQIEVSLKKYELSRTLGGVTIDTGVKYEIEFEWNH